MNNMDHVLYGNFQSGSTAGGYCVGMESGGLGGMVMVGSGGGGGGGYQSEADHHHHHRVVGYSSISNPADAGYDNNFLSGNSSVTVLSSDDAAASVVAVPRPSHHNHHHHQLQDMMTMMMQRGGSGGGNGMSHSTTISSKSEYHHHHHQEGSSAAIRAKIASHALYPNLLHAYIDCQKLGAPPEIASFLDEIRRESVTDLSNSRRPTAVAATATSCLGADPELDQFMESYCELLVRYKMDLTKPFDEATNFLNHIESQFNSLCNPSSSSIATNISADEAAGSSDEDGSGIDVEAQDCSASSEDRGLKDKLLRKYSGYISNLKHEFSKKKKKGKLPKESRQILLNWWNVHYKWPYPTEADKIALADSTGLDQKQINNWFINQRKRHWKPSENMQFAVVDSLYGPFFMND